MTERAWQDMIVGDRMQVDQEFSEQIRQSQFSQQEWGLIMTAVELKIEGSGEDANLVADTTQVPDIVPELGKIQEQMNSMMGAQKQSGGFISSLKKTFGFSGRKVDEQTVHDAERLAQEYAEALEAHLRENGKWKLVRGPE